MLLVTRYNISLVINRIIKFSITKNTLHMVYLCMWSQLVESQKQEIGLCLTINSPCPCSAHILPLIYTHTHTHTYANCIIFKVYISSTCAVYFHTVLKKYNIWNIRPFPKTPLKLTKIHTKKMHNCTEIVFISPK